MRGPAAGLASLALCGCSSSGELFVERVWGDDEAAVIVAVDPDGGETPILVPPGAAARRLTADVSPDATYYARTFDTLDRWMLVGCEVSLGGTERASLGDPRAAWRGEASDGAIRFVPEDEPRPFDVRIFACDPPPRSCDAIATIIDGGETYRSLYSLSVVDEELALFGGFERAETDRRTLTMRLDHNGVHVLPPQESLRGLLPGLDFDGEGTIGALGGTVFRIDLDGTVTASASLPFEVLEVETGRDGTTFFYGVNGELAVVSRGEIEPRPFPAPSYGEPDDRSEIAIDVVDAGHLALIGPDSTVWHYVDEAWHRRLAPVDGEAIVVDETAIIVVQDDGPVIMQRGGAGRWEPISDLFIAQNAIQGEALGDGRFLIGGQAGTLGYYNGERMCTVPVATDRNIEELDLTPSGDHAYAVGESYGSRDGPTLILRIDLPRAP